jgi:hypothetical protein
MAEPGDPRTPPVAGLLMPAPHLLTNHKTRLTTTETRIIEAIGTIDVDIVADDTDVAGQPAEP